jgi:hypothetical protein
MGRRTFFGLCNPNSCFLIVATGGTAFVSSHHNEGAVHPREQKYAPGADEWVIEAGWSCTAAVLTVKLSLNLPTRRMGRSNACTH